jgi:metal-responsive CopG/Arc/MetJ family transcriptional regulator
MAPRRKTNEDKRVKISVTIPKELVIWLDKMVEERAFASRSHGVELGLMAAMQKQQGTERRSSK